MSQVFENINRIDPTVEADSVNGKVVYAPVKSLFLLSMYAATIYGLLQYLRWKSHRTSGPM